MNFLKHLLAAALAAVSFAASATSATTFPSKTITIYMPYTAGVGVDVMLRLIAQEASTVLGQPIVVQNNPGGLQRLGIEAMKRAPADGYTLSVTSDSLSVVQPLIDPGFHNEVGKDYVPIAFLYSFPLVLVGRGNLPIGDMKSLVDTAHAQPGKLTIGGGTGSIGHTAAVRLGQAAKADLMFVPYRDAGQATPDLMGGRIDLMLGGVALRPSVTSGAVKGYATTGSTRWELFPELPTLKELGIDMVAQVWFGLTAHAATPPDVVAKLNAAFLKALDSENVKRRMKEQGMATGPRSVAEFQSFIESETQAWGPAMKSANIKLR